MRNNDTYARFVKKGVFADSERDQKLLVGMGCGGEGGEVCDELKKVVLHGKPFDRDKLVKELGDMLWYIQLGCNVFGLTVEEIIEDNVRKLCARYPERYGKPESWLKEDGE